MFHLFLVFDKGCDRLMIDWLYKYNQCVYCWFIWGVEKYELWNMKKANTNVDKCVINEMALSDTLRDKWYCWSSISWRRSWWSGSKCEPSKTSKWSSDLCNKDAKYKGTNEVFLFFEEDDKYLKTKKLETWKRGREDEGRKDGEGWLTLLSILNEYNRWIRWFGRIREYEIGLNRIEDTWKARHWKDLVNNE